METKSHFVVTFVSLIFLGVIVLKPDALKKNHEDRRCQVDKGRMECQYQSLDYKVTQSDSQKISDQSFE